ncbi:hypothetical protein OAJ86_01805 [Nitrosopumilus sp.]|nr:hypothetical protein [Nitrosopumilus sp.]
MDEELTNYCFKKFCIVLEEIDDDDVRLILEHEKNGFSIQFKIKVLEIKKLVLDLEIIGNNISNNSLNPDGIIKQLSDMGIKQKADAGYYSNILEFDGLNAELPTLDLAINDAFISIPFVDFNELKKFCDIFKQMVLNIFSQFNIDFNNVENVISNISQVENKLKKPEEIEEMIRTQDGKLYKITTDFGRYRKEYDEQVIKSLNNFIQKTTLDEFEKDIIEKINAIPLINKVNPNKIGLWQLMHDILTKTILINLPHEELYQTGFGTLQRYSLTPIQKKYFDIIKDYSSWDRKSKTVLQAQEEASEIILEQLKSYEKVTKSLIKSLLIKNKFPYTSMTGLVYLKYQESIK